uniref:Uncharacterized protein n=1 Tax=Triticum urartu TaxID=4572 RepID=A0A8R7RA31_TRIUA
LLREKPRSRGAYGAAAIAAAISFSSSSGLPRPGARRSANLAPGSCSSGRAPPSPPRHTAPGARHPRLTGRSSSTPHGVNPGSERRFAAAPKSPTMPRARRPRREWSDGVPPELLGVIFLDLACLADRVCFAAVCP